MNHLLDLICQTENELLTIYEDKKDVMKEELSSMRGINMFGSFYSSLKGINEYYHKYPHTSSLEDSSIVIPPFEVSFFRIHFINLFELTTIFHF